MGQRPTVGQGNPFRRRRHFPLSFSPNTVKILSLLDPDPDALTVFGESSLGRLEVSDLISPGGFPAGEHVAPVLAFALLGFEDAVEGLFQRLQLPMNSPLNILLGDELGGGLLREKWAI